MREKKGFKWAKIEGKGGGEHFFSLLWKGRKRARRLAKSLVWQKGDPRERKWSLLPFYLPGSEGEKEGRFEIFFCC